MGQRPGDDFFIPLLRGGAVESAVAGVCFYERRTLQRGTHPSTPLKRGIAQALCFCWTSIPQQSHT
jgi:hypothetical protein